MRHDMMTNRPVLLLFYQKMLQILKLFILEIYYRVSTIGIHGIGIEINCVVITSDITKTIQEHVCIV